MKKIIFVMPFMAISLLASCNNNKAKVLDLFKRADMYDETGENPIGYVTFEYKNNLLVKETAYNLADEMMQQSELSYDKHNNLVFMSISNIEGSSQLKYDYEYDDNGRVTCEIYSVKNGDSEWKYDDKAEYTYEEFKTSANNYHYYESSGWGFVNTDEWYYDDNHRLIKHKLTSQYSGYEETHTYDEYGCDVEIIKKYEGSEQKTKKECEYYKHLSNRPSKITITDEEGQAGRNRIEEYEYDKHLNVTLYKKYNINTPDKYETFIRYSY